MGRPKGSKNKKTLKREKLDAAGVARAKTVREARLSKYAAKLAARDKRAADDDKKADIALNALVRIADALEGLDLGKQLPKFLELLPLVVTETKSVFDKSRDEDDTPHACDGTHGDAPHANGKVDHAEAAK